MKITFVTIALAGILLSVFCGQRDGWKLVWEENFESEYNRV